jgi:DGQHR domain-containing protein
MKSATDPTQEPNPQDREAIAKHLEPFLNSPESLLVHKTQMGGTEAFIGSVTLDWLDRNVGYASQLPLFKRHLNPETVNVERVADTVEDILQRPLDWSRQLPLAQYLATHKAHKFPALLVVICPSWVNNPKAFEWDEDGRATESAIAFQGLDHQGQLGLLHLTSDEAVFALDGQHRLMGIQGLMKLLRSGKLQPYSKIKKAVGEAITLEDMTEVSALTPEEIKNLASETIGIEFIPAVVTGETRQQARQRVRSIFVHVNLMAVKLSKGQLALLDEDDGFSIVTRQVAVTHPLLMDKRDRNPRINWDSATVASKSTVLTTLQALKEMTQRYLCDRFPHWFSPKPGLVPMRPDDDELEEGMQELRRLLDALASLPSYQRLERGEETPVLRRFSFEKPGGESNILFRPVGQVAIAQGLGVLVFQQKKPIVSLFEKLRSFDAMGGFKGIEYPESLWYGVLFDPNKRRIRVAGRDLAAKLLVYVLGGIDEPMDRAELRRALAEARTFENRAISFEGRFVKPREIKLPSIL